MYFLSIQNTWTSRPGRSARHPTPSKRHICIYVLRPSRAVGIRKREGREGFVVMTTINIGMALLIIIVDIRVCITFICNIIG